MKDGPKFPNVTVRLAGEDGNAFAILGRVRDAMRDANIDEKDIKAYLDKAKSGDYDNLLITTMEYVDTE